jgi:hypothetical protein
VGEFCRQMKTKADALRDLGHPVPEPTLVLNVLRGLNSSFDHLRTWITRQKPFLTFLQVWDDLVLEEITRGPVTASPTFASSTSKALVTTPPTSASHSSSLLGPPSSGPSGGGGGKGEKGGRRRRGGVVERGGTSNLGGAGGGGGHTSGGAGGGGGGTNLGGAGGGRRGSVSTPAPGGMPWPSFANPWSGRISMWPFQGQPAAMLTGAPPFGPAWTPQPSQSQPWPGGGDQATLAQSFSTMGLTPPVGTEWIADSGASFHTTPDAGILSSVHPAHPSYPSSIMVGDGSCLPVTSVGSVPGPLRLSRVLVAPQMIHNLLSIRQFIADNSCFIEFDSSGLTVKDLATRRPLLPSDSVGPLYTLRLPSSAAPPASYSSSSSSAALATTPTTWRCRLGHPGRDVLARLSRSADISCTRALTEHFCHACQLDRHVRLPFYSSSSHALHAFDLVQCDLWTSPVSSISGYKYYLVVVDDFSHYSWTFPLRAKSETFPTLLHFFAWVSTQFGLTIKAVQCDNRREFDNHTSRSFFLSRGVQLRMSCPYTSPQNGKAERMLRTTNDHTHPSDPGLPAPALLG